MRLRRGEVLLGVGALIVAGVCVRLGIWQLHRLAERRARNAEIRAARERPPLEVTGPGMAAESVAHRRILVRGVYDYEHERVWRGRTYEGMPGVHVITPLELPGGGSAVLVDRGWVPSPDAARIDLSAWRGPDSAVVRGYGVALPRGRGDVDPRLLADSVPYVLLPFGVQALPPDSPRGGPAGASRVGRRPPIPVPPPALDEGPHLFYAVQWFSFALVALVGTGALLRRSAGERARLPLPPSRGDIS
ncbi:MAG TPA: SURF1 family protein [Gemmatimonadales bacterium]|nr:SURF1 family protein [Gemmatimonadales bacterium]